MSTADVSFNLTAVGMNEILQELLASNQQLRASNARLERDLQLVHNKLDEHITGRQAQEDHPHASTNSAKPQETQSGQVDNTTQEPVVRPVSTSGSLQNNKDQVDASNSLGDDSQVDTSENLRVPRATSVSSSRSSSQHKRQATKTPHRDEESDLDQDSDMDEDMIPPVRPSINSFFPKKVYTDRPSKKLLSLIHI